MHKGTHRCPTLDPPNELGPRRGRRRQRVVGRGARRQCEPTTLSSIADGIVHWQWRNKNRGAAACLTDHGPESAMPHAMQEEKGQRKADQSSRWRRCNREQQRTLCFAMPSRCYVGQSNGLPLKGRCAASDRRTIQGNSSGSPSSPSAAVVARSACNHKSAPPTDSISCLACRLNSKLGLNAR